MELAAATQAGVSHGPRADWQYGSVLQEGQTFTFGRIKLATIYTPGHTDESVSFVLTDLASGKNPVIVFSGDALFVGDTGRVDLYGPAEIERMSTSLFESIFKRILPLGDGVILCPAHGAGSVCGLNIADRDESTLGTERLQNLALQYNNIMDFVRYKSAERPERPPYFSKMEKYNLAGPPLLHGFPSPQPLTAAEFKNEIDEGAVVLDASWPAAFGGAHVKGSYSIWLEGLAAFGGWVLPYDKPIVLVLEDPSQIDTAVRYLIRLGYDRIAGFLKDGIEGWYNAGFAIEQLPLLSVHQLKAQLDHKEEITVLDVRDEAEWDSGHVEGALHIYVGHVAERLAEIPSDRPLAVMCSVGHRGGLASSLLLRAGFLHVYNVLGGFTAWRHAGYPVKKNILEKV